MSEHLPGCALDQRGIWIRLEARFQYANAQVIGQADAMRQRQGHGLGVDAQGVGEHGQRQHGAVVQAHQHKGAMAGQFHAQHAFRREVRVG